MTPLPDWWTALITRLQVELPKRNIGVYASGGAPFHHCALIALWGGIPLPVTAEQIRSGGLDQLDVLIMPGGGLRAMSGLLEPLGMQGTTRIREWVEQGGLYIGSCAGAFLGSPSTEDFVELHPEAAALQMLSSPVANAGRDALGALHSPGVGVLRARNTNPSHWLTAGLAPEFPLVHYNGPCFRPLEGEPGPVTLEGITSDFTPWERSLPRSHANQPALVERLAQEQVALVQTGPVSLGRAVLFGSHPEFGFDVLQLGWGPGVQLLANALLASRTRATPEQPHSQSQALEDQTEVSAELREISAALISLADQPPPLHNQPAFLGRPAEDIWHLSLREAAELADKTANALEALEGLPANYMAWWDAKPSRNQDYGFTGLKQLVHSIQRLLSDAEQLLHNRSTMGQAASHPYDHWFENPYHLLASSYLSVAGLTASAALAITVMLQLANSSANPPIPLTAELSFNAARDGKGVMS